MLRFHRSYNPTYRNDGELYFIRNMELISIHDLTEVEEHPSIPVHTLNEAKAIPHCCNHTLQQPNQQLQFNPCYVTSIWAAPRVRSWQEGLNPGKTLGLSNVLPCKPWCSWPCSTWNADKFFPPHSWMKNEVENINLSHYQGLKLKNLPVLQHRKHSGAALQTFFIYRSI